MLTEEQIAIIRSKGNIKINAVAGSGKTTTLIEYAKARPAEKILYLAFNKAVRLEAVNKFSEQGVSNVQVETAHSLAFSHIVRRSDYKLKNEGYKTQEIVEILGLQNSDGQHTEYILATHILAFVSCFCNSDKSKVQELNYEDVVTDPDAKKIALRFKEDIAQKTRIFLDKMNRAEIPIIHDFYLKKFQLSKPVLYFDTILFDEGQDASEAMLAIFLSQQANKVIVGDAHQQIYGWRYAVNSLDKVDYPAYHLSTSFRFDGDIASLAKKIIGWKEHLGFPVNIKINGAGKHRKVKTRAVIARTNTGLLAKAIELLIEKKEIKSVYFEGRIENYTYAGEGASIYDVLNLYTGEKIWIRDKMIASMKNIDELETYIENTGDASLHLMVEMVKEYGKSLPAYIKKLKDSHLEHDDKHKADMIFSTVHKAKGMEYDEVTLADDFITEEKIVGMIGSEEGMSDARITEEINLLYVAVTRTKTILNLPEDEPEGKSKSKPTAKPSGKFTGKPAGKSPAGASPKSPAHPSAPSPGRQHQSVREKLRNNNGPWSSRDDARLIELYQQGKSHNVIAAIFERPPGSIAARLRKLLME